MFFHAVKWSPVEVDYLKAHRGDTSIEQLSIALAKSRNAIKKKLDELDGKPQPVKMSKRSKIGKREDLGMFLRSGWEANVCRWLRKEGKIFRYEPKVFVFEKVKHGTVSYLPDLQVGDEWWEIKGLLDKKSKTALNRFKKYYPEEFKKLRAIVGRPGTAADKFFKALGVPVVAYMNELDKQYKHTLPHWE